MYTLISAIAKPLGGGGRWTSVELGNMLMTAIYSTYSKVYAVLSNPFLDHNVSLDLSLIRPEHGGENITFNDVLASLGNASLPTSDTIPTINTRYAKYKDAFRAGYKVTPTHPLFSPDAQMPAAEKHWLRLTKPNTDMSKVHDHCLVSVNGFYHFTDGDADSVYVVNGMDSQTVSRQNCIGLHNFQKIGKLTLIPITEGMLYKQNPAEQYKNRCFVDLGQDVADKSVMLVLGGYLHVQDNHVLYRTGVDQFCINMQALPLLDRYYESRKYLDLSSLQLESTSRNDTQISIADFFSDAVLTRYLTLSQSFFVIVDNPDLFAQRKTVHKTRMPGMFVSYTKPEYPLVTGVGRVADYWYTLEDGQYSLTVTDSSRDNPIYQTTDALAENSVADSRVTYNPVMNAPGQFLMIGSDL